MDVRPQIAGFLIRRKVGVFRHPSRGIEPDPVPSPLRHDKRDAPPVCGRPPGVSCPVRQDHVTLSLASLPIGLAAVVADQGLGVGFYQPFGMPAASEPLQHRRLSYPSLLRFKRPYGRFEFYHRLRRIPHALKVRVEFRSRTRIANGQASRRSPC